ncbi:MULTISPECIES: hypothetical protein [unclassified Streptosporangium]|uniref:hypothetical protein n=1 Tax=unclassified Streptosporangium TaxID=2632669 RepID=UPI002E2AC331|nr:MULTISPECIES: hypothetical protein [unclassified Streptosporangium]
MPRATTSVSVSVAVLTLAVLTGCGEAPTGGALAAGSAASTSEPQDKRRLMEATRVDCMKRKGFKYTADVPAPRVPVPEKIQEQTGEYQKIKLYRHKYGFGVFARHLYPQLYNEHGLDNPNQPVLRSLSQTQRAAWDAADAACYGTAFSTLTGKKATSLSDAFTQINRRSEQLEDDALNGDAQLVELARSFGECLSARGHKITSLKPTQISQNGRLRFEAESARLGAAQNPDTRGADSFIPQLTPDQAEPYLKREISAAIEDLECGRDFYARYNPRSREIREKVDQEFGVKDGLL